ncbi:hypothetical protein LTR97_002154 [Elasticomyces elasticus]|uniref:Uncharacterized protein n=1 Tax=Elasticomyces elasticus TaxID=574655 RepID=A0AAN8A551_9PEZI|nr:hypothetical protein LTR97_002154 [Elasticomyces elasticus]
MVDDGPVMRDLATRHGFVLKRMPSQSQSRGSDVDLPVEDLYSPSRNGVFSENWGGAQADMGPWFKGRKGSVRSTRSLNSRPELFSERLALLRNDAAPERYRVKAVDYSLSFGGRGRRLSGSAEEEGRRNCLRRCLRGYECVCDPTET